MKTLLRCLPFAAALFSTAGFGACQIPSPVTSIPDGATATEQQLLAAQSEVEAYVAAMDAYIACENEAITTEGSDAAAEFLYAIAERIDFARGEVDRMAQFFNEQVEAFRAARGPGFGLRQPGNFPGASGAGQGQLPPGDNFDRPR